MALPMPSLHIATTTNAISTITSDWESTIIWRRIISSALPTPHNSITREELQKDDGDFTSLLRIHAKSQFHNFRLDYSTPFGFSAGAEYTYYNSPDEQWLKSSLYDEIYDITSQQRIDKWHAYLKQEHDLGKDWGLNYGINYTTSRDKSSQENNNKSSDGNTIQNEDQMSFYIGASKSFGQKLTMEASLHGRILPHPNLG